MPLTAFKFSFIPVLSLLRSQADIAVDRDPTGAATDTGYQAEGVVG
jgi:hypothetical protein